MDGVCLQDKISRGMGLAARKLGAPFVVYRPAAHIDPLSSRNRIIKLFASFNAEDPRYQTVAGFGHPIWWGVFDNSYTQAGDYLVGASGIYFICAQQPLLPVQCVLTNRIVSIARAPAPTTGGYSGLSSVSSVEIVNGYPASVLEAGSRAGDGSVRAQRFNGWTMLLPALSVAPQVGDVITDDALMTYVVGSAEMSSLGWRLLVRQIAP